MYMLMTKGDVCNK